MPVFFDIETQNTFDEVGGRFPERLNVSVVVTYNTADQAYHRYTEAQVPALITELQSADLVIGFNQLGFDYPVLQRYTSVVLKDLPTLDLMQKVERALGFRLGLDALASATLGEGKSSDGLQAVRWWREGRVEEIFVYCQKDVEVTKRLYEFGKKNGYVQYFDRKYQLRRVPIAW